MAFAVKYRMELTDRLRQHTYRVDIETDNYAGAIIQLGHTFDGIELIYNEKEWVQGFEGVFSFHTEKANTVTYDPDFYNSTYKQFKVKFFINNVLKNVGWLKQENTTREFLGPTVQYRVSFTDALNDLKTVDYTDSFRDSGFQPILTVIKNALDLGGITDLDFAIQCNLYEDQLMSSTDNLFKVLKINNAAFFDIQGEGKIKPDTCFTVLEKCVKPFYCRLAQVDGYWQITNGQEYTSQRDIYSYSTLLAVSENVTYGRVVEITTNSVEKSRLELTKVPPVKKLITTWRNKKLGTNVLSNGNFSTSDTTGWTNGINDEAWGVFDGSLNRLLLGATTTNTNPNTRKTFSSATFNIADKGDGKGYFSLTFKMSLKSLVYTAGDYISAPPQYKVELVYPGGTRIIVGSQGVIEEGETTYDLTFAQAWPVDTIGNYSLKFTYIPPNEGLDPNSQLQIIELEIDDIEITHTATDVRGTTDKQYHSSPSSGLTGYLTLEEDIYFADGTSLADAGIIVDTSLTNFTKSWTRWGKSPVEKKSLVGQFNQQYLNDRGNYFDKIDVQGLIDSDETINFNSILLLNSKPYRFIEYSKNFKKKTISGTIQQVDNGTDLGVTEKVKALFAQWGVSWKDLKRIPPPSRGGGGLLDAIEAIFKGSVGIGGAIPTAKFHLPKGFAGAGLAPLKFTMSDVDPVTGEGARLTTPEDGAVEYYQTADGEHHLTMTIQGTRYEMTNRIFLEIIDTSGSVITFDMQHQTQKFLKASKNLLIPTVWEFINDEEFVKGRFTFLAAAFVDHRMPSNVTMSDSRFTEEATAERPANSWRPNDLGVYEARFFKDGQYYQIEMYGPYRNLNKAPEIVNNVISLSGGVLDGGRTYFDFEGDQENNPPPQALDISISGVAEVGQQLTLVYTFFSPSGYAFSLANIQWYRANEDGTSESVIPGATGTTYTPTLDDINKLIYCKFTVAQTATAPANGNPTSIEYTSPSKLILEIVAAERGETIGFSATFTAEVTSAVEPPIAWADKLLASAVSATFNTDVDPVIPNQGSGAAWTTVDATKPVRNATTGALEFRNAHRAVGPSNTFPGVFDLFVRAKYTEDPGNILSHGNNALLANDSSGNYIMPGLTPQPGDRLEHVFYLRMNGINSKFCVDNGTVITFDEATTTATFLVLGQGNSGGNAGDFDFFELYRTAQGSLMTDPEVAQMWAFLGK